MSKAVQRRKQFNVLAIGDSCDDIYHFCKQERLNPETSCPLLLHSVTETRPGMVLNVAANLKSLGSSVTIMTSEKRSKKERFISVDSLYQYLRVDNDIHAEPLSINDYIKNFNTNLYDAVIISDYNKGFLDCNTINDIIDFTISTNVPVFIDTKQQILEYFDKNNVFIKINEIESKRACVDNNSFEFAKLIITLGSAGARYNDKIFPSFQTKVYDVCGAGDTFLAAFVVEYLTTKSCESAITFANKAAAIAVQHNGTYAVTLSDMEKYENIC